MQTPLIFEHIPKTAGTTLLNIFARYFPPKTTLQIVPQQRNSQLEEFDSLPMAERMKYSLIIGHAAYLSRKSLPDGQICFSFVRDPIDRVISHYNYILGQPTHPLYEKVAVGNMDFKTYLTSGVTRENDNYMTRAFSLLKYKDFSADPRAAVQKAIENLERDFFFIGLVERFDLSLLVLSKLLNWKTPPYYYRENASKIQRISRSELDPEILEIVREKNQMDYEVFNYVEQRFSKLVERLGPGIEAELPEFKQGKQAYARRKKPQKIIRDSLMLVKHKIQRALRQL